MSAPILTKEIDNLIIGIVFILACFQYPVFAAIFLPIAVLCKYQDYRLEKRYSRKV